MGIHVGVIGAAGRMGAETCAAIEADPDLDLAARIGSTDPLSLLVDESCEVAVDFTVPGAVMDNVRFCLSNGIHAVVGTTGLGDEQFEAIESLCKEHSTNAFIAPNFAIGAVLMMWCAAKTSTYFDSAEIIERHHEGKRDAPSGTAIRTAGLMNEARARPWEEPVLRAESLPNTRGGELDGIRIHSVRLPGSVAHQEVILGGSGQTLTIRHDSIDRSSFMPGVVLAVKKVAEMPGLTVGLEALLDLE